ncbi:MAG TPA: isocitrate lyase/phosphoenolpyruvate mutase family protein [Steroidobacteraceae bacterium]|jgi:2-methylisocitrate lyase-like PEP mutase family enzyme
MTVSTADTAARRQAFRALHESGCFVIPNPWDAGSARYLEGLGFKALATTSAGSAWRHAHADGRLSLERVLTDLREMVTATGLPVNADFESGFAQDAEGVARNVRLALDTGIAGLSLEDATGLPSNPLRDIESSAQRIRAARAAIDEAGGDTLLVGRAENFIVGQPDLEDTIRRLKAYSDAGADCLYAPGISTAQEISAVVAAVAPKPVNLLVGSTSSLTLDDVATLGVRRISVGGALAQAAWGGFMEAARTLARGRFDGFSPAAPGRELNTFFKIAEDIVPVMKAEVVGTVEYRLGEGPNEVIRPGSVEVVLSPGDATLSWSDGSWRGEAAMPFASFCRYITAGAIVVQISHSRAGR